MRVQVRRSLPILALLLCLCGLTLAQSLQPAAVQQIQAILQEKLHRTPAQLKLDSHLHLSGQAARGVLNRSIMPALRNVTSGLEFEGAGRVHVDIDCSVNDALLAQIAAMGGRVESSFPAYRAIRAWIPLLSLEALASRSDVTFIKPAEKAFLSSGSGTAPPKRSAAQARANVRRQLESALPALDRRRRLMTQLGLFARPVDTSGLVSEGADLVQNQGITGSGIKIGVLSDGVKSLAALQAAGDLPSVTVLSGQAGPASGDEGTAMLEILYDLAPGASLYFATAFNGEPQFASNIQALAAAGCQIIVDDVIYFDEGVFQDGIVARAINTVTANGVLYFSAAGNYGNLDSGTSGTWEGDFANSGVSIPFINAEETQAVAVHTFDGVHDYDAVTLASGTNPVVLKWADPLGGACNDYDLFILDASMSTIEDQSTNPQTCTQDPYEASRISPTANQRIVVVLYNGATRALHMVFPGGRLASSTNGATFGHSAAAAALTVAATPAQTTIFTASNQAPESYDSDGPRKIFYNPDGSAITPGNFLFGTNGGTTLQKVDFTAADGGQSAVSGFNPFFGTSAAAPAASAIAALVMSANPTLTPAQVVSQMKSTALAPQVGFLSRTTGSGIVMANLAAVPAPILAITKSHSGNFTQGQTSAAYTVTVSNQAGRPTTTGTVTVTETLPGGLALVSMAGTGWNCASNTCTRTDGLAGGSSYPAITVTVNVAANAASPQVNQVSVAGGGSASANTSDSTTITGIPPILGIAKSHTGNFSAGQNGATYTLNVSNSPGAGFTSGTVTVTETLPGGLTLVSMAGTGWACASNTCTRSDVLAGGSSYPAITVTANVAANATSPQVNQVSVTGGGSASANTSDSTIINANPAVLSITKSHNGSFTQGQSGVTYAVRVSNTAGAGVTSGAVTVTETLPSGLALVSMAGTGWNCASNTCTRSDGLAGGSSYPAITVTANVAANATSPQVNQVSVTGGGSASANTSDSTTINANPAALSIATSHTGSFTQGQTGASYTVTVSNGAGAGTTSGNVTVVETLPSGLALVSMTGSGWICSSNSCTRNDGLAGGASYPVITVIVNVAGNASSPQVNQVSVTGGNSTSANASDSTIINGNAPSLSIKKTHSGNFTQGQFGAAYTLTVNNSPGAGSTSGTVTVTETLPGGLTLVSMTGPGWTCLLNTCGRNDALAGGASYPAIAVIVNVAGNAALQVTNQASVSGGGSLTAATSDVTVINQLLPAAVSVTPSSGSGNTQTFSVVFTDPLGASDLTSAQVIINPVVSGLTSCYVWVDPLHNSVYLTNDTYNSWPGTSLGTGGALQNSQCTVNATASSVVSSGNTLTVNLSVSFQAGYSGAKNVFGYATTQEGLNTGWQKLGTWNVVASAQAVSVTPSAGSGSGQMFTMVFSDPNGGSDLTSAQVIINPGVVGVSSCYVWVDPLHNGLYLTNDAYSSWPGTALGGSWTLQNSQCTVNAAASNVVYSGNTLTVNLAVSFQATYAGVQNVFGYATTAGGLNTGWQKLGTYTVVPGPQAVAVTPSSGSGGSQTFRLFFNDTSGAADLTSAQVIINSGVIGSSSCYIWVDPAHSGVYLTNDAYNSWPGTALGGAGILQNSQCTVNAAASSVAVSGNTLTVTLALAFQPGYTGAKNIYAYATTAGGLNSGWQKVGTWTPH